MVPLLAVYFWRGKASGIGGIARILLLAVLAVPALWWALIAYGVSVGVWVVGLSRVPVGQAYPLLSMGYAINILLAWWLIGEVPNVQRVVGVGVIIVGVVLVTRS